MTDSVTIARRQLTELDNGHVSEDVAEWCMKISHGVSKAVVEMPIGNHEKIQALRLSAVMLLCLCDEQGDNHDQP